MIASKIIVCHWVKDLTQLQDFFQKIDHSIQAIEFRLDHMDIEFAIFSNELLKLPRNLKIILTDHLNFSNQALKYIQFLKNNPTVFLDVDFSHFQKNNLFQEFLPRLIISAHLKSIQELQPTYLKMKEILPPFVAKKIVFPALHLNENLTVLNLLREAQNEKQNLNCFSMGEYSNISRLMMLKFPHTSTYSFFAGETPTASGQIDYETLKNFYYALDINQETALYGVIGNPIKQSKSPALFNPLFKKNNFNARYLFLPLVAKDEKEFTHYLNELIENQEVNFQGASVTVPYKEWLFHWAKNHNYAMDELTKKLGAANTLKIQKEKIEIKNTDALAFLKTFMQAKPAITREPILILGAGGVAKTIVGILAYEFPSTPIVVLNRTFEKAQQLAKFFAQNKIIPIKKINELKQYSFQSVINCTSVGMFPHIEDSPLSEEIIASLQLTSDALFYDTVYNPPQTRFLQQGEKLKAKIFNGESMFSEQAKLQFQFWFSL